MVVKKNSGIHRFLLMTAFILYLLILVYFLFFAEMFGRNDSSSVQNIFSGQIEAFRINLVPFKEINRYLFNMDKIGIFSVVLNLGGNILAFVPFGYYICRISPRKCCVLAAVSESALFSIAVELLQLITRRGSCDVDDVILNTLGGFIGTMICFFAIRRKKRRR